VYGVIGLRIGLEDFQMCTNVLKKVSMNVFWARETE
jgi:hypothetical protein